MFDIECKGCAARRKVMAEFYERMRVWIKHPIGPMPTLPIQDFSDESQKAIDIKIDAS